MKETKYLQIRVIAQDDPAQFQSEFNAAQIELASKKPKTTFSIEGDTFKAVIEYTVTEYIPETAQDQAQLDGIRVTCDECPYFERDKNKDGTPRMISKHGSCPLCDSVRMDQDACEWFYRKVLLGEAKPISKEVSR